MAASCEVPLWAEVHAACLDQAKKTLVTCCDMDLDKYKLVLVESDNKFPFVRSSYLKHHGY